MSKNKIIALFGLLLCVSTGHAMDKKRLLEANYLRVETSDKKELVLHRDVVKEFPKLYDAWCATNQADNLPTELPSITSQTMGTLLSIFGCDFRDKSIRLNENAVSKFYEQSENFVKAETIELSIDCLNAANFLKNSYLKKGYIKLLVGFFESDEFFEYVANKNTTYTQYLNDRIPKDLLNAFTLPMQIWKQKKMIEYPAQEDIAALAVFSDGKTFAVGCSNQTYIYDETGTQLDQIQKGVRYNNSLAVCGNILAIGAVDKTLTLYDLNQKRIVGNTSLDSCVCVLAFAPDNKIWVGLSDGTLQRINPESMTGTLIVPVSNCRVCSIACSPDGSKVAYSIANTTCIINTATGKVRHKVATGYLQMLAFSPDSQWLVVGDSDGILRFIDPNTGKIDKSFCVWPDAIRSIEFLADNNTMIAVGYFSGDVSLIDLSTNDHRLIARPCTGGYLLQGLAYCAAGTRLMRVYGKYTSISSHLSIDESITNSLEDSFMYRYNEWQKKKTV